MSEIPAELRYAASHEWARDEADGTITVGITDHAQDALGDLVFVEVPEVGRQVAANEACAVGSGSYLPFCFRYSAKSLLRARRTAGSLATPLSLSTFSISGGRMPACGSGR